MDIIENIQNAVLNQINGAKVLPWNNGGIQIKVEDKMDIAAVLSCAADMMGDYGGDDIQITTNQKQHDVFIDICEREDDDDEEEEEDEDDDDEEDESSVPGKVHNPVQVGDIICYRGGLVRVCRVNREEKTVYVMDSYGAGGTFDAETIAEFNEGLEI